MKMNDRSMSFIQMLAFGLGATLLLVFAAASASIGSDPATGDILDDAQLARVRGGADCTCYELQRTDCQEGGCDACHQKNGGEPANCVSPAQEPTGAMRQSCSTVGVENDKECRIQADVHCANWHDCDAQQIIINTTCGAGPVCMPPGMMMGWQCRACLTGEDQGTDHDMPDKECAVDLNCS